MHKILASLVLLGLCAAAAQAQEKKKPKKPVAAEPVEEVDVSAVRDRLIVVSDGKGHFIATAKELLPRDDAWSGRFFYSPDGKVFWDQRIGTLGSQGPGQFYLGFWEPRVFEGYKKSFTLKDGAFTLQCDDRLTEFKPLPEAESKAMLAAASFRAPRWKHTAYALARDDRGRYYYVDRPRQPEDSKAFRLFKGEKGALKPLKMTNVVSDSEGDIFATKSGQLRLLIPKQEVKDSAAREPTWVAGKQKVRLTWVPLDMSGKLIYTELGVYAGQALGTPCDDL